MGDSVPGLMPPPVCLPAAGLLPLERDSLLHPSLRRLTLEALKAMPRESLAWVSQLPRDSVTFQELQRMMNEEEQRCVAEDDTSSFEALESRLKTPKRPQQSRVQRTVEDNDDKENVPVDATRMRNGEVARDVPEIKCMTRSTSMSDLALVAPDDPVPVHRSTSLLSLGAEGSLSALVP